MIDVKNLKLHFNNKIIFNDASLQIQDNARIGIVGANGSGKTTLLRVLVGKIDFDDGTIERSKNLSIGYLPQDLIELEAIPLMSLLKNRAGIDSVEKKLRELEARLETQSPESVSELLSEHSRLERRFENLGGFAFEAMAMKILHGLGFAKGDELKNCAEFSGGWKMRIAIAALLIASHDVLLLDEPTNHLDTESMEWLEGWLRTHKGAVVAVSHDQRFLENIASNIAEIENGKIIFYPYEYDQYLEIRQQRREQLEKLFTQQQSKIQKIESFVNRFRYKATKAAQVQSRIKQLEKIERLEKIELSQNPKSVKIAIPESEPSGWEVLKVTDMSKNYGALQVFHDISFTLNRGERVALVGVNGAGKSTLLRIISSNESATSGNLKLGHNVNFAYFSQESANNITYTRTIWEEARAVSSKLNDIERRNLLGAFLFSGEDIHKQVSVLSGGEKARLALYKLMLTETNFLILDEPTNHLDQNTREIVERALLKYQGTLLIVSHDRHFLDTLAERVLEIRDGNLYDYPGNYSYFLEKREETLAAKLQIQNPKQKPQLDKQQRDEQLKLKRELRKKISQTEQLISELEARKQAIDSDLCNPEILANSERIKNLMIERNKLESQLEAQYSIWENLSQELESVSPK